MILTFKRHSQTQHPCAIPIYPAVHLNTWSTSSGVARRLVLCHGRTLDIMRAVTWDQAGKLKEEGKKRQTREICTYCMWSLEVRLSSLLMPSIHSKIKSKRENVTRTFWLLRSWNRLPRDPITKWLQHETYSKVRKWLQGSKSNLKGIKQTKININEYIFKFSQDKATEKTTHSLRCRSMWMC
jgi:hypothetical protein